MRRGTYSLYVKICNSGGMCRGVYSHYIQRYVTVTLEVCVVIICQSCQYPAEMYISNRVNEPQFFLITKTPWVCLYKKGKYLIVVIYQFYRE